MSEEVLYNGHGRIEIYPLNTSILGIVAHELRHANFNRYIALLKDKQVDQDIKITLQYKDGHLYPDKAYTEAKFKNKISREELLLKIIFLKIKIRKLKSNSKDNTEVKDYEKELNSLQKKLFQEENISNIHNFKKENAKLIGFFKDIYFYQKFNLPPVSLNAPFFKDAYDIEKKLNEIYRENLDNYEFQYKNIQLTDDLSIMAKEYAYQKTYDYIENFDNYLKNFSLPLKKVDTVYSDYFTVSPNDNAEVKTHKISILKKNKSLIVYSNQYPDIYEALNLSGSPKINGVEIDIEPSDSLYDIMEKINWGEDLNHNYQLDPGEDINGNNQLDGGTKDHGVFAYIENNKLYLKNVLTGDIKMIIDDDNNVFHDLGIIAENPLNNETYFPHILQKGQDAEIVIDGNDLKSHTGIFEYDNMTITIKKLIDNATFSIVPNDDGIYNKIVDLINNYNQIIDLLNGYLKKNETLENDLGLMIIKRGMKLSFFYNYNELLEKGIDIKNDKNYLYELEILSIPKSKFKDKFQNSIIDELYNIGIRSNKDEIIVFDKAKLKSAIKKDPFSLKELFFSNNGIINNLTNFFEKILDKDYGLIKTEQENISSENFKKLKKGLTKEQLTFEYFLSKLRSIEGIIQSPEIE